MQYPVNSDPLGNSLKINPVVADSVAQQFFPIPLDHPKPLWISLVAFFRERFKIR